jgi:hypothetical protein
MNLATGRKQGEKVSAISLIGTDGVPFFETTLTNAGEIRLMACSRYGTEWLTYIHVHGLSEYLDSTTWRFYGEEGEMRAMRVVRLLAEALRHALSMRDEKKALTFFRKYLETCF